MERPSLLLDWDNQHSKNGNSTKINLQFHCNHHQNPNTILYRPQKNNIQLHMEEKKNRIAKQSSTTKELPGASPSLTPSSIIEL